jgi:uncharacterized protein (DUF736 family)
MTMNVGYLKTLKDGSIGGYISTLKFSASFMFQPIKDKRSDRAPDYDLSVRTKDGREVAVGVVWKREIKRGDQAGKTMFSLAFDDPSLPQPLNVNAYPDENGDPGAYVLSWTRERERKAA